MGIIILRLSQGPWRALCAGGWECPLRREGRAPALSLRDKTPARVGRGENQRPDYSDFVRKPLP